MVVTVSQQVGGQLTSQPELQMLQEPKSLEYASVSLTCGNACFI